MSSSILATVPDVGAALVTHTAQEFADVAIGLCNKPQVLLALRRHILKVLFGRGRRLAVDGDAEEAMSTPLGKNSTTSAVPTRAFAPKVFAAGIEHGLLATAELSGLLDRPRHVVLS